MVRMEMVISILVFVVIMLFSIGIFCYIHQRKERWELSKRIKRMSGGIIRSEEITHFLYKIKDQLLGLVGSLGNLFRFKGEKESSLRDRFMKAGYRTEDISVVFSGSRSSWPSCFLGFFP